MQYLSVQKYEIVRVLRFKHRQRGQASSSTSSLGSSSWRGDLTTITNRIVTRGFGPSRGLAGRAGPVTQGYGGPPSFVVEAFARRVHGRSGKRPDDELNTVILWAKLIELNDQAPPKKIEGFVRVPVKQGRLGVVAERLSVIVRDAWSEIKVTAERIRRRPR
jgi:hypothetical protein